MTRQVWRYRAGRGAESKSEDTSRGPSFDEGPSVSENDWSKPLDDGTPPDSMDAATLDHRRTMPRHSVKCALEPMELWGGSECSIVRIRNRWRDQSIETGHRERPADIAIIADLGFDRWRLPILWEHVARDAPDRPDFSWPDRRLAELQAKGMSPIAGLLHHGSGPHYTDLLDPDFPLKFADYAGLVAARYPWIDAWTPINEPLTTARFSALYGHWYPHHRDQRSFLRALVNQCTAIRLAMEAIRAVNPVARLVQTEDVGKTFSTPALEDQARFENERRWLSLDLLAGRVDDAHRFRLLIDEAGIPATAIEAFRDGRTIPDIIGANHYLTSERYLDDRLHFYPGHPPGGNGREVYVDVEAVRISSLAGEVGIAPRLRELWSRYRLPIALTEVHHGCTRDEQLRWSVEAWQTAELLRQDGVDLRAITFWSAFGATDWRSLLTRDDGIYDVGLFDVRAPRPRPTAVAAAARTLGTGKAFDHPILDVPGWWRRHERLYAWQGRQQTEAGPARRLLIIGASGTLGQAFAAICAHRGLAFRLTSRAALDICSPASIAKALDETRPWAVINAAGFVRVADAERERDACMAWNRDGARNLATACAQLDIPMMTFSSDLVFDGKAGRPYTEDDEVAPACVYGASKAEAERLVLGECAKSLVIRTAAFFGPWDRHNFAWSVLSRLRDGVAIEACPLTHVSPTFVPDLCHAALDLLIDGEVGIWHLANAGETSWFGFARAIADRAGYAATPLVESGGRTTRISTALGSCRGQIMRGFDRALDAYLAQMLEQPLKAATG